MYIFLLRFFTIRRGRMIKMSKFNDITLSVFVQKIRLRSIRSNKNNSSSLSFFYNEFIFTMKQSSNVNYQSTKTSTSNN